MLEIWTVLSTASEPLTSGQVGDRLETWGMNTSSTTATRRLEDAVKHINTICTHTVLCEEGKPTILHTYPHNGALHVVVEDTLGKPLWTGDMTVVFQESSVNSISEPTLNRTVPEMEQDFTKMKKSSKKKAVTDSAVAGQKDPRAEENTKFKMDYPPISLEAIVETTKNGKKVVLTRQEYEEWQETLPPPPEMPADEQDDEEQDADKQKKQPEGDKKQKAAKQKKQPRDNKEQDADEPKVETQNRRSPPRRFYLKSILSPEEWQLLTDMILVYPYISERETDKLLSAMARIAPGSRQWNKLVHAPKHRMPFALTLSASWRMRFRTSTRSASNTGATSWAISWAAGSPGFRMTDNPIMWRTRMR